MSQQYTTDFTVDYEIRYSITTKMFEVFFRGERIDWMLPSYRDGEDSILLHHAVKQANDEAWAWAFANAPTAELEYEADAGMQRAAEAIYRRYPGATYGRWNDYVTALAVNSEPMVLMAPYAVITLPDGYAVHCVLPSGALGAHIETLHWHDAAETIVAVDYALAA